MEFKGTIDVCHLAELLYDPKICGVEKIRDSVKIPLTGTKVAVHYGCHLMKPKKERHLGSTLRTRCGLRNWSRHSVPRRSSTGTRCSAVVPAAVSVGTISSMPSTSPTRS